MTIGKTMSCKKCSFFGKLYNAIVKKAILKIFKTNIKSEPLMMNRKVLLKVEEKAKTKDANKIITLIALQPSTTLAKYLL